MRFHTIHRLSALCAATLLMLAIGTASAQYTGPSAEPAYNTVEQVLAHPVDDAVVTLDGHLLQKLDHKHYVFSDGTGKITAEIKAKRLPLTSFNEKTKVRIVGEVDKDLMQAPKIEVKALSILP